MRKALLLLVVALSLSAFSCSRAPVTSSTEQPDDVVGTPGGLAYRANVHQQGVPDRWPPVEMATTTLGSEADPVQIMYRSLIDTKAGQTRNNILYIYLPGVTPGSPDFGKSMTSNITAVGLPPGFSVNPDGTWIGPSPGMRSELVLKIEISRQVEPGVYSLEFDVNINGEDYGKLPCTMKVEQ